MTEQGLPPRDGIALRDVPSLLGLAIATSARPTTREPAPRSMGEPRPARAPHRQGAAVEARAQSRYANPEDHDAVMRWLQRDSRPTALDLFCGAGGPKQDRARPGHQPSLASKSTCTWSAMSSSHG